MKLAYLVSLYPSANHTYILREIRQLRAMGLDVEVVSVRADARPLQALTPEEREERARTFVVTAAGVGAVVAAHAATFFTRPRGYLRGIAHAIRLGRADLAKIAYSLFYFGEAVVVGRWMASRGIARVHTHYATNVVLALSHVFPVETSATIHGSGEFHDPQANRLPEKIAAIGFVCAISQYGLSQLMRVSPPPQWSKFELTPLGVDARDFAPRTTARAARADSAPFTVSCVGQLQPAKGQHVLLAALAALVGEGRDVRLTLVGDGPDRDALVEHVGRLGLTDRVTFTGALNQDEVRAVYDRTDAFVLASFAEGVPVVLMEAMAAGIPCVATRITGIPELIRDGEDGLLVTPASASELAQAIARLADDPELGARLAASARHRVAEHYDLERNVARLASVFRRRYEG